MGQLGRVACSPPRRTRTGLAPPSVNPPKRDTTELLLTGVDSPADCQGFLQVSAGRVHVVCGGVLGQRPFCLGRALHHVLVAGPLLFDSFELQCCLVLLLLQETKFRGHPCHDLVQMLGVLPQQHEWPGIAGR